MMVMEYESTDEQDASVRGEQIGHGEERRRWPQREGSSSRSRVAERETSRVPWALLGAVTLPDTTGVTVLPILQALCRRFSRKKVETAGWYGAIRPGKAACSVLIESRQPLYTVVCRGLAIYCVSLRTMEYCVWSSSTLQPQRPDFSACLSRGW